MRRDFFTSERARAHHVLTEALIPKVKPLTTSEIAENSLTSSIVNKVISSSAQGSQVRRTAPVKGVDVSSKAVGKIAKSLRLGGVSAEDGMAFLTKLRKGEFDDEPPEADEEDDEGKDTTPSNDNTFDSKIDLKQLRQLRKLFENADLDKGGDLDENEFLDAFRPVLKDLTPEQLRLWFSRIDANANGTIDWDEFSTYIMLEGTQKILDEAIQHEFVRNAVPDSKKLRSKTHHGMVNGILVHPRFQRYYTYSRDGVVKSWKSATCEFDSTLHVADGWISDGCFTRNASRVIFSALDKKIWMYECATNELARTFVGKLKHGKEMKEMSTRYNTADSGSSAALHHTRVQDPMVYGGSMVTCHLERLTGEQSFKGFRTAVGRNRDTKCMKVDSTVLKGMVDAPTSVHHVQLADEAPEVLLTGLRNGGLLAYRLESHKTTLSAVQKLTPHSESISKMRYSEIVDGVITASWDCHIKIINIETGQARLLGQDYGHTKSVFSLDWNEATKVIASCGAERAVYMWDPFYSKKPVFKLEGHVAPVLSVVIDDVGNNIASISVDKVVKIWDMRTFRCLQSLQDTRYYTPENVCTALAYDQRRQSIVTAATHPVSWQLRRHVSQATQGGNAHKKPVVGALYNKHNHQIVSADSENVYVWDVDTGEKVTGFTPSHHMPTETDLITTIAFDKTQRRLVLGSHTGHITMWNFINGQMLNTFTRPTQDEVEVTVAANIILYKHDYRFVFGVCGNVLTAWKDAENGEVKPSGSHTHSHNLLCVESISHTLCAFGTDSGTVLLVNINSLKESGVLGTYVPLLAVECLLFLTSKATILIAVLSSGHMQFWCIRRRCLLHQFLQTKVLDLALTRVCSDEVGNYLFCSDDLGDITVINISAIPSHAYSIHESQLVVERSFNAHDGIVTGLAYCDSKEVIISSGMDCKVRLHTRDGIHIGNIGQPLRWVLGEPKSYAGPADPPTGPDVRARLSQTSASANASEFMSEFTNVEQLQTRKKTFRMRQQRLKEFRALQTASALVAEAIAAEELTLNEQSPSGEAATVTPRLNLASQSATVIVPRPAITKEAPAPPPLTPRKIAGVTPKGPMRANNIGTFHELSTAFGNVVVPTPPRGRFRRVPRRMKGEDVAVDEPAELNHLMSTNLIEGVDATSAVEEPVSPRSPIRTLTINTAANVVLEPPAMDGFPRESPPKELPSPSGASDASTVTLPRFGEFGQGASYHFNLKNKRHKRTLGSDRNGVALNVNRICTLLSVLPVDTREFPLPKPAGRPVHASPQFPFTDMFCGEGVSM